MSWHHVEDTEPVPGHFESRVERKDGAVSVETSTETMALSVWRCGSCRALAVTHKGHRPDGKCGKCSS